MADLVTHFLGLRNKDKARVFSEVHNERTSDNGHKILQGKFWCDTREVSFTTRVVECLNRLLREAMELPSLDILQLRWALNCSMKPK